MNTPKNKLCTNLYFSTFLITFTATYELLFLSIQNYCLLNTAPSHENISVVTDHYPPQHSCILAVCMIKTILVKNSLDDLTQLRSLCQTNEAGMLLSNSFEKCEDWKWESFPVTPWFKFLKSSSHQINNPTMVPMLKVLQVWQKQTRKFF